VSVNRRNPRSSVLLPTTLQRWRLSASYRLPRTRQHRRAGARHRAHRTPIRHFGAGRDEKWIIRHDGTTTSGFHGQHASAALMDRGSVRPSHSVAGPEAVVSPVWWDLSSFVVVGRTVRRDNYRDARASFDACGPSLWISRMMDKTAKSGSLSNSTLDNCNAVTAQIISS